MNSFGYSADVAPRTRWLESLRGLNGWLDGAAPVGDLLARLWVAHAFWVSGLTKIQTWDSTLYLFANEYSVPLLTPEVAAYAGTFVELVFPLLLVLGLGGRFAAFVLFVFNLVAVMSYPDLGAAGLEQHKAWGLMLLISWLHGPGPLSLDHLIHRRRLTDRVLIEAYPTLRS